jgi:guanylate kinase
MIFVVSGPGGVGKGTVVRHLLARMPGLWLSRSWTSRPRRPGEDPHAYTFVDREAFGRAVAAGGFLEHAEFNGNLYGTPWPDPPAGADVILEIELQGARQVKERHPDAVLVLLVPPSPAVQAERMRARGDDEEHVRARLAIGAREEAEGRGIADHVVVNDDLDRAVAEVAGILATYRSGAAPAPPDQPA